MIFCVFGFANVIIQINNEYNVVLAVGCPYIVNPMIWLKKSLAFSQMITHKMLKYVKFGRNCYGPSD
jgi:hypothetical protein